MAADVTLGDAGVRDGDCIMVVQDGLDQGQQSEPLDDRIADLERSIRGELAMQVQTQLAALRGSLPSQARSTLGCLAGDLEDDDEAVDDETNMQTVLTSRSTRANRASSGAVAARRRFAGHGDAAQRADGRARGEDVGAHGRRGPPRHACRARRRQ